MPYFKQSLEIKKKVYGEEHPKVALGLNNLALLLKQQVCRWANILWYCFLHDVAVLLSYQVCGWEHFLLLCPLHDVAQLLSDQVCVVEVCFVLLRV